MERQTRQRLAILRALQASGRSLSPPELLALAQREVSTLNLSTVYRQLRALVAEGQARSVELPGLLARYEAVAESNHPCAGDCGTHGVHHHAADGRVAPGPGPAPAHRHHFHCTRCDEVTPIDRCPGGIEALAPNGWQVERHDLTLHGRCGKCADAAPPGTFAAR